MSHDVTKHQASFKTCPRVLVIGSGVMGLTTALELVQHGYQVTVLSKDFVSPDNKSKLTSQVAAGLWQLPSYYSNWRNDKVRENVRRWALRSYSIYSRLSQDAKHTGVYFRPRIFLYCTKINDSPEAKLFMENHSRLPGFQHSDQIIAEYGFSTTCGLKDAFLFSAPQIDTDVFLCWLTGQCMSHGVKFVRETIHGPLRTQCDSLMRKYKAGRIVNCTGVNARELAEDKDVYPMKGAGLILNFPDAPFHCPRFGTEVHYQWFDNHLDVGGKVIIVSRAYQEFWRGCKAIFHEPLSLLNWRKETPSKGGVLVIGAGAIGLTTALELVKHGYRVTVLAKDFMAPDSKSKLTSQVAAAYSTIPVHSYKWKGQHVERKIREWSMLGYEVLSKLAMNSKETGVFMKTKVNAYYHPVNDVENLRRLNEDHSTFPGFRHSAEILKEKGISQETGLVDATSFVTPFTDTDVFMLWLTKQCISNGVDFVQETIHGPLRTQCDWLMKKYRVDGIVNCTGVNARELAEDDDVYSATGLGLLISNTDSGIKPMDFGLTVLGKRAWYDEKTKTSGFICIAPRGDHSLWIGTIKQESYKTDFHIDDPITSRMLSECQKLYPPLRTIPRNKIQVMVGRRPVRKGGPRVEQDSRYPYLMHNYGHGSYGIQLSWGCAQEMLHIMEKSTIAKSSKL